MTQQQRWQDWVMLAFGAWLFFSPFYLGYDSTTGIAAANSYIVGTLVAIFAVCSLANPEQWEERINLALGIWLILAPLVLQFRANRIAMANEIILGILITIDALWALHAEPTGA
jgi:SPW repeat-containing protein